MEMKLHRIFSGPYRLLSLAATLAVGAVLMPHGALAQATGYTSDTDPLSPGYIHRASRMLSTGNPLGSADQLAACADQFDALSPALKAEWLALEGSALYEREDPACVSVLQRLATEYPASPRASQALLTLGDWYWVHTKLQAA